jgi:hypothetical protein
MGSKWKSSSLNYRDRINKGINVKLDTIKKYGIKKEEIDINKVNEKVKLISINYEFLFINLALYQRIQI